MTVLDLNTKLEEKVKSKTIEEVAHEIYKVENASSKKESIGVVLENEVADKDHHEKFTEEDEEKVTVGQKTIEEVVNEICKENVSSKKGSFGVVIENEVEEKDHHEKFTEEDEEKVTVGQKTIEEVVNEIAGNPTIWSVLFVIVAMSYGFSVDSLTYLTVFAGTLSYKKWECVSTLCTKLFNNSTDKTDFYTRNTLCNSNLKLNEDFVFTNDGRTSLAVDWGLFCDGEPKMSFLSSSIFAGAYVGFLVASPLFDTLGRKKVTIGAAILTLITTIAGGFSQNYYLMVVLRFFCGVGKNACWMGIYCWILEFTPARMRTFMTILAYTSHGTGFLLVDMVGYYVKDWRHIFYIISTVTFLGTVPMFFVPESPRFFLTKNKLSKAKASLERFSRYIGSPKSMAEVNLVFTPYKQNWLKQMKDFYVYPKLGIQTMLLALVWMLTCALSYTFNFGWSKISKDFYMGYAFAAVGTILSYYLIIPVNILLGKKRGMLCFLVISGLSYCFAMIDYNISLDFTIEHLASLLGFMTITSTYTMTNQYTGELTPTSHRGMVFCICGSFGRIGSFLGPYVQLLFTILDKRITFGIFTGVTIICGIIVTFTRDPTGKDMPETPAELSKVK